MADEYDVELALSLLQDWNNGNIGAVCHVLHGDAKLTAMVCHEMIADGYGKESVLKLYHALSDHADVINAE